VVSPKPLDGNPVVQPITVAVAAAGEMPQSVSVSTSGNVITVTLETTPAAGDQHACGKVRVPFLPAGTYSVNLKVQHQGSAPISVGAPASFQLQAPPVPPAGIPADYSFADTAAFGEITFSHAVSADGVAEIHIPIAVPPGRQGVQPQMALDYSSRDGNGPLGVGWRLSGLSSVTACRQVPALDGGYGGTYPDRFCLDGQRLVPVILGLDGNRPTPVNGVEYRQEKNPFDRVVAHGAPSTPDWFEVFAADGMIYRYASRGNSGARTEGNVVSCYWGHVDKSNFWTDAFGDCPAGGLQRRAWQLDEVADRFGNRMEIDYDATEPLLPTEVRYTYHLRPPTKYLPLINTYRANTKRMVFEYEPRQDARTFSLDGIDYKTQKRLKTIRVIGPTGLSHPNYAKQVGVLWQYTLSYSLNPVTQQSTLDQLSQCVGDSSDGPCKAPLQFSYTGTSMQYTDTLLPITVPHGPGQTEFGVEGFRIADVNGDGLDDVLYRDSNKVVPVPVWHYQLSDGAQLGPEQSTNLIGAADTASYGIVFADLDRNDTVDALIPTPTDDYGTVTYSIAQGRTSGSMQTVALPSTSFFLPSYKYPPRGDGEVLPDLGRDDKIVAIADLDGDGLPDLVLRYGGMPAFERWGYARNKSDAASVIFDFAEDFISSGNACTREDNNPYSGNNFSNCANAQDTDPAFVVDIDGNGVNEIIVPRGDRFGDPGHARPPWFYDPELVALGLLAPLERHTGLSSKRMPRVFIDVNGDGLADAVHMEKTPDAAPTRPGFNQLLVALNRGGSFGPPQAAISSGSVVDALSQPNEMRVGDFNNDGLEDIYEVSTGTLLLSNGQGGFTPTTLPFPVGEDTCQDPNCPDYTRRGWDQILDFNGDGLIDFLQMRADGPHLLLRVGPAPALLSQVTGGSMTADVRFTYAPAPQVHTPTTCTYPQRCLKKGMWLVAEMAERADSPSATYPDGYNRKTYTYAGGRYDERGRGWLGFEHRVATDLQSGTTVSTDFDNSTLISDASGYYNYPGALRPTRVTTVVDARLPGEPSGHIHRSTVTFQYADNVVPGYCPCAMASLPSSVTKTEEESNANGATQSAFVPTKSSISKYVFDPYGLMIDYFAQSFEGGLGADGGPPASAKIKSLEVVKIPPPTIDTSDWLIRRYSSTWETSTEPARDAVAASTDGPATPAEPQQVITRAFDIGWQPHTLAINHIKAQPASADSSLLRDTSITFDPTGNIATVTTTAESGQGVTSRVDTINWDNLDKTFPYQATNAAQQTQIAYYHAGIGQQAATIDLNGLATVTTFDGFGRIKSMHAPSSAVLNFDYSETSVGLEVIARGSDGGVQERRVNKWGQTVHTEETRLDGAMAAVDTTYTRTHALLTQTLPHYGGIQNGNLPILIDYIPAQVSFVYDNLGRLRSRRISDGHRPLQAAASEQETWTYSRLSQQHTDMRAIQSSVDFDSLTRMVRVTTAAPPPVLHAALAKDHHLLAPPAERVTSRYEYAPFSQLQAITDTAGNRRAYGYDDLGRLTDVWDPSSGHANAQFNGYGEAVFITDAAGDQTRVYRDALGRIYFSGYYDPNQPASAMQTFAWDSAAHGIGKLSSATSLDGIKTDYAYDTLSRPTKQTWTVSGESFVLETVWDTLDRPQYLKYPQAGGSQLVVEYDYQPTGTLSAIRDQATQAPYWQLLSQDATGAKLSEQLGATLRTQHSLDTRARLGSVTTTATSPAGKSSTIQSITYDYGAGNLIKDRNTAVDASTQATEAFDYDFLGRLTEWTVTQTRGVSQQKYGYDNLGNLTSLSVDAGTGRTATALYGASPVSPNAGPYAIRELDEANAMSVYSYDLSGRQIAATGRTVTWNGYNLPSFINIELPLNAQVGLQYDAEHTRTVKAGPIDTVTSIGGAYERHTAGAGYNHVFNLIGPGGVFGQIAWAQANGAVTPTSTNYLHADILGTPETISDAATNTTAEKVEYEPFGERRSPGSLATPANLASAHDMGFTGQMPDDEVHLINMRGRIYDPQTTRFLSPDPAMSTELTVGTLNAYAYVENNPVNFTDPSGFQADPLGITWSYDEIGGTDGPIDSDWEWQSPPPSSGYGSAPHQSPSATRPTTTSDQTRPAPDAGPGWGGSLTTTGTGPTMSAFTPRQWFMPTGSPYVADPDFYVWFSTEGKLEGQAVQLSKVTRALRNLFLEPEVSGELVFIAGQ
jgi:RHS repeat-associated protein